MSKNSKIWLEVKQHVLTINASNSIKAKLMKVSDAKLKGLRCSKFMNIMSASYRKLQGVFFISKPLLSVKVGFLVFYSEVMLWCSLTYTVDKHWLIN